MYREVMCLPETYDELLSLINLNIKQLKVRKTEYLLCLNSSLRMNIKNCFITSIILSVREQFSSASSLFEGFWSVIEKIQVENVPPAVK